jgi:hypothetical protein
VVSATTRSPSRTTSWRDVRRMSMRW